MSVLIEGMEMPKRGHTITITIVGNGQTYVEYFDCRPHVKETIEYTAVSVPPHGRLIDADALEDSFEPSDFWNPDAEDNCFAAVRIVHSAPTIIPASKEAE